MHMIYIAIPLVYDGNLLTPQMARAIGRAWESYWGSYFKCRKRYLCALWSLGVGAAAGRGCEMFMTAWVLVPLQGAAAGCVRLCVCVCVCLSVCVCQLLSLRNLLIHVQSRGPSLSPVVDGHRRGHW